MIIVHTDVLSGVGICLCCNQESLVLCRPALRTGVVAGHHDGFGHRNQTHGAGHVVIPATLNRIIEVPAGD